MSDAASFENFIERASYHAGWITIIIAAALLILFFIAPVHAAETKSLPTEPTIKLIRQGTTPLLSLAATKAPADKMKTISTETLKAMKTGTIAGSTVTIEKYRYDEKTGCQVYWISATRGGQEVKINNPIWIYGAPIDVLVSETTDTKLNEITITVREDSKSAMEGILTRYANNQPIGKATVGTKS